MKILQITSSFFPVIGGQEKVVYEVSKKLAEKGHKITVLTTDLFCKEKPKKKESIDGFEVIRFKNNLFLGGYGYSREAYSWLKKNWRNYDVIHSHGYNRFLSEFAVYFLRNKNPAVFTSHGFMHTKKNIFFKIIHDLTLGKFIKYAKACTALTKLDFKEYKKLGIKKEKIFEVPNGINFKDFSKKDSEKVRVIKKKFGKFLLYVGRIHESKGLQHVFEAIKGIDAKLVIIGKDAGYKKYLQNLSNKLGIANKIFFMHDVSDKEIINYYKSSEFFILFSEWEGFGIVVLEAMASGKPAIVSNRGSLPFLVKNEGRGFVVSFKDIKELHKKIKELLDNEEMKKSMGKRGKEFSSKYDWSKIINKLERIYKK